MKKFIYAVSLIAIFLAGCSAINPSVPSIESLPSIATASNIGLLGEYHLDINTTDMTADLTLSRSSTIGESFLVSGMYYFTGGICADCLKIKSVGRDFSDYMVVTFTLKHPFEMGNTSLPPSAKNRLDLDIFDPRMIIRNTSLTPIQFPLSSAALNPVRVANFNGYTHELADFIGSDLLLPFVLIQDDTTEIPVTNNHFNRFRMGASKDFSLRFWLAQDETFEFDMYLTFSYGVSAKLAQRLNPTYYNPEFNRKEAWKVNAIPGGYWDSMDNVNPVNVIVEVYDWQAGANVNSNLENTSDVYASSEIVSVSAEIVGMTNTLPSVSYPISGNGTPTDPFLFHVPIVNENLLSANSYNVLVRVLDSRSPQPVTSNRDFLIHTPDGITRQQYVIPEYATYTYFLAYVN